MTYHLNLKKEGNHLCIILSKRTTFKDNIMYNINTFIKEEVPSTTLTKGETLCLK